MYFEGEVVQSRRKHQENNENLCASKEATIWSSLSTILKTRSPGMGEEGLSRVEMLEDQSKLDELPTIVATS